MVISSTLINYEGIFFFFKSSSIEKVEKEIVRDRIKKRRGNFRVGKKQGNENASLRFLIARWSMAP